MRTARLNVPGVCYHLIWRFVDRGWYFADATERARYLRFLGAALGKSDWRLLAFALMSNHIHLAAVAGRLPMSSWTKRVNSPFVRWMNERHGRLGSMIAERARDYAVLPSNEPAVIAYVHNNPVRAGVVDDPAASAWTSHRAYLGLEPAPPWLHVREGLARCGMDATQFAEFVRQAAGQTDELALEEIRRAVRSRGAIHIGTPTSVIASAPLVVRPFARTRPDPRRIVALAAAMLGVDATELSSRRRASQLVEGRRIIVHAGIRLGFAASDMGATLAMTPQGAAAAANRALTADQAVVARRVIEQLALETGNL